MTCNYPQSGFCSSRLEEEFESGASGPCVWVYSLPDVAIRQVTSKLEILRVNLLLEQKARSLELPCPWRTVVAHDIRDNITGPRHQIVFRRWQPYFN